MSETDADVAFWSLPTERLLDRLQSSEQGLTQVDASERLARTRQWKAHRRSAWALLLDQFKNPIILLLFCSAIRSFSLIDDQTNAGIILLLVASGLLAIIRAITRLYGFGMEAIKRLFYRDWAH